MKESIKDLFRDLGPYINYICPEGLKNIGDGYLLTFELNVKGICEMKNHVPVECDKWLLCIKLTDMYPAEPPQCEFIADKRYKKPYHPHVKRSDGFLRSKECQWIDYQESSEESLLQLLLRICKSIQYNPAYIRRDLPKSQVGNEEAMDWYNTFYNKNPDNFPWDRNPLLPIEIVEQQIPDSNMLPGSEMKAIGVEETEEKLEFADISPESEFMDNPLNEEKAKEEVLGLGNGRFYISKTSEPYQPVLKIKPDFDIDQDLKSDNRTGKGEFELYILKEAQEVIFNQLDWMADSPANRIEQGGLLVGEVYRDSSAHCSFGVVEAAIPATDTDGSATHLAINHTSWKQMTDHIDREYPDKQIIGWYHTHPDQLDVYMSDEDLRTQQTMFPKDWQFAVILNPHKGIWRVFRGYDAKECQGYIVVQEPDSQKTRT